MDPAADCDAPDNATLAQEFGLDFDNLSPTERSMLLRSRAAGIRPYEGGPERCEPATMERQDTGSGIAAPADPPRRMNKKRASRGPSNLKRRSNKHNTGGSFPNGELSNPPFHYRRFYIQPQHQHASTGHISPVRWQEGASVACMPDKFSVNVDTRNFAPKEISIKTEDNCVVIHAKHEEKPDDRGGYVKREFMRRYVLPEDVDPETVKCHLKPNGHLALEAPRKNAPKGAKPIPIEVQHVLAEK